MGNPAAKAHLALVVVNLVYAANYLIAKGLMPEMIGPSGFILGRVFLASLVFLAIVLLFHRERIVGYRDWLRIAVCAAFGVCGNQLLFFNGLNLTSPGNAAIIMTSTPVLVLFMSSIILGVRLTPRKGLGIVLGGAGAILLILNKEGVAQGISSSRGDLFVFLNAMSYGLYLVLVKPLMKKYSALTVITRVFLVGTLMVLPFGWDQLVNAPWDLWQSQHWYAFTYVVIGVTVMAYLLNLYSLRHVEPTVTSSYIYLQPLATLLLVVLSYRLGWGEDYMDFTWIKMLYGLMIFAGVYLISANSRARRVKGE